ncbi:hypothetical protein [Corallococcus macrosporus]|uniref:Putative lipoprotein n=1 Tax=Myxococcus fulvus (strain ATCC BAA-855 / HW-1) TaxID=483219 RepID=F8C8I3_MYXFH|nr:hypothetical protein [Corallococcus macrosporus]AEI62029.1 putative lipoprotein [Corallococcus macrosporus]
MKKIMLSTCVCAALALTACGGDSDRLDSVQDEQPPAPSGPVQTEDGKRFELRLRGSSMEGYDKLELPIGAVRVTVDGKPLKVELAKDRVDVAAADHAPLVAYFYVPEGVERVRVSLQLDGLGGYTKAGAPGYIDAAVAPMTFEAPVHELALRGRAVVQLDVARSLVDLGSHHLLLPNGVVNY